MNEMSDGRLQRLTKCVFSLGFSVVFSLTFLTESVKKSVKKNFGVDFQSVKKTFLTDLASTAQNFPEPAAGIHLSDLPHTTQLPRRTLFLSLYTHTHPVTSTAGFKQFRAI